MTRMSTLLADDVHNRKLLSNVYPAGWVNPTPEPIYNMVVVGAGTAGLISAIATATLGGKVALVERQAMGGDCLNVGCVPSKSLIRPARLAAEMRDAASFGLTSAHIGSKDFPHVMERVRKIRAGISKNDSVQRYAESGVHVFLGEGVFTDPGTVEVGGARLRFRKAVVVTGARAVHPDIPGLDDVGFLTNETVFNLNELPNHLLVVGGGPIGCELAQAFRRLGAEVTIVQHSRFLPHEDEDAAGLLADVFQKEGIRVLLHAKTLGFERGESGRKRAILEFEGEPLAIEVDEILVGAGRAPNVEGIGLEAAGVEFDARKGVGVNDTLQTTNKNIYAAGDCCMAWKFTHAADAAAQIVVQNALFKGRRKLSSLIMPWCTYTYPEIAHVGMYERDARSKGLEVDVFKVNMDENDRALTDGESLGFVKVMVRKGTDRILGATIVSAHAGEMISEITTAMVTKTGLGRLAKIIHPYPTQADSIRRVAGLYNKARLTPLVAKVLKWWLKAQR
jgi:pyruvate/2-oxoglutarate dehydrogenase complex dihydrolipoamide dehydrogenase (E3) component